MYLRYKKKQIDKCLFLSKNEFCEICPNIDRPVMDISHRPPYRPAVKKLDFAKWKQFTIPVSWSWNEQRILSSTATSLMREQPEPLSLSRVGGQSFSLSARESTKRMLRSVTCYYMTTRCQTIIIKIVFSYFRELEIFGCIGRYVCEITYIAVVEIFKYKFCADCNNLMYLRRQQLEGIVQKAISQACNFCFRSFD